MQSLQRLGTTLRESYERAGRNDQILSLYIFGIRYADLIRHYGIREVIEAAGFSPSMRTELSKAIRLAPFVELR